MTINKLASLICQKEGKKSQARMGDVKEILGILSDLVYDQFIDVSDLLAKNGEKRAKRKSKKK